MFICCFGINPPNLSSLQDRQDDQAGMARTIVAINYLLYPSIAILFEKVFHLRSWVIPIFLAGAGVEAIYSYFSVFKEIVNGIGHYCGILVVWASGGVASVDTV